MFAKVYSLKVEKDFFIWVITFVCLYQCTWLHHNLMYWDMWIQLNIILSNPTFQACRSNSWVHQLEVYVCIFIKLLNGDELLKMILGRFGLGPLGVKTCKFLLHMGDHDKLMTTCMSCLPLSEWLWYIALIVIDTSVGLVPGQKLLR